MGKTIIFIFIFLIISSIVIAQNFKFLYNPYTTRLDRTLDLNQSEFNLTVDNLIVNQIQVKNITSPFVNQSYIFFQSDGSVGIMLDPK